jgi:hypothetical protein
MLVQPDSIWGNLGPSQIAQKDTKCQNKRKKLEFRLAGLEIQVILQNVHFVFLKN